VKEKLKARSPTEVEEEEKCGKIDVCSEGVEVSGRRAKRES
jgi:hypothetical protein